MKYNNTEKLLHLAGIIPIIKNCCYRKS